MAIIKSNGFIQDGLHHNSQDRSGSNFQTETSTPSFNRFHVSPSGMTSTRFAAGSTSSQFRPPSNTATLNSSPSSSSSSPFYPNHYQGHTQERNEYQHATRDTQTLPSLSSIFPTSIISTTASPQFYATPNSSKFQKLPQVINGWDRSFGEDRDSPRPEIEAGHSSGGKKRKGVESDHAGIDRVLDLQDSAENDGRRFHLPLPELKKREGSLDLRQPSWNASSNTISRPIKRLANGEDLTPFFPLQNALSSGGKTTPSVSSSPGFIFDLSSSQPSNSEPLIAPFKTKSSKSDSSRNKPEYYQALDQAPISYPTNRNFNSGPYFSDRPTPTSQFHKIKSGADLYNPRWIRLNGDSREGWCSLCEEGKGDWYNLNDPNYASHLICSHGVSPTTTQKIPPPTSLRTVSSNHQPVIKKSRVESLRKDEAPSSSTSKDPPVAFVDDQSQVEGFCESCGEWKYIARLGGFDWKKWFKHSSKHGKRVES